MEFWLMIVAMIFIMWLLGTIIKAIINNATNTPTWKGVIISALLGALPFYLFMCWLGVWGEEKQDRLQNF